MAEVSNESAVWNKLNSTWRRLVDSSSITINRSVPDEIKLEAVPAADLTQGVILGREAGGGTGPTQSLTGTQAAAILPDASESQRGVVEHATDAEIYAATTGNFVVTADGIASASVGVALTDAATVALDWGAGIYRTLTITANRVLGNPTNGQPGTWRTIMVQGNNTTDRTLTFASNFGGEHPDLADIDDTKWYLLSIFCVTTSHFVAFAGDGSPP